jgi:hypothetical protein
MGPGIHVGICDCTALLVVAERSDSLLSVSSCAICYVHESREIM